MTPNPPDAIYAAAFGAVPNDGQDDTDAILRAVAALKTSGAHRLVLAPGTYDLRRALPVGANALFAFSGLHGIVVDGNGALLRFHERLTPFHFDHCSDVVIKNLAIDWDRPFFSQGRVLRSSQFTMDVQIDDQYPVTGKEDYEALLDYDPVTRLPLANLDVLSSAAIVAHDLIGPQQLRVTLRTPADEAQKQHFLQAVSELPGHLVVLRHVVYGNWGIDCIECTNVLVEDVDIFTVPGMGIHCQRTHDVTLRRLKIRIKPDSGRLMSTTADAQFFAFCTGLITIEDGLIEGTGDDGLNFLDKYRTLLAFIDSHTVAATVNDESWSGPLPQPGEKFEIADQRTLALRGIAVVRSAHWNPERKAFEIQFETPINGLARVGDLLASEKYLPKGKIVRTTFRGLRSRAMLLSARNILVEDCRFEYVGFAAIQLLAGTRSHFQGPTTEDATFRRNTFVGCGGAAIYADISVPDPAPGLHRHITIEDNTVTEDPALFAKRFKRNHPQWTYWRSAICLTSVADVTIRGNRLEGYDPAIYLDRAQNVRADHNKVTPASTLVFNPDRTTNIEAHDNDGLVLSPDREHAYDSTIRFIHVFR